MTPQGMSENWRIERMALSMALNVFIVRLEHLHPKCEPSPPLSTPQRVPWTFKMTSAIL